MKTEIVPTTSRCRFCGTPLEHTFVDLGMSPLCQTHIERRQLNSMEPFYPLHAFVCKECFLVQLGQYVSANEIFSEYAYFSSFSDSWLTHCRTFASNMEAALSLSRDSVVVEVASNDGYLLQYFKEQGQKVYGVEPAANVADVAIGKGIPTVVEFLGVETAGRIAREHGRADLLIGNNVLAHVPDLNDFVGGLRILLAENGTLTMEFPHLFKLMEFNQFDTIYHEHFSYFSLTTAERVFSSHGMTLFDVEELPTHGGSIRIHVRHNSQSDRRISPRVNELRANERAMGVGNLETYTRFGARVEAAKRRLLDVLISIRGEGKTIVGYGAPGKGNTLLNYCGIRTDFLKFTVDRNPYKQGKFTPGTHIPILDPAMIKEARPDYVLILPWNLKDEIMAQNSFIREWGGRFIIPIPEAKIE